MIMHYFGKNPMGIPAYLDHSTKENSLFWIGVSSSIGKRSSSGHVAFCFRPQKNRANIRGFGSKSIWKLHLFRCFCCSVFVRCSCQKTNPQNHQQHVETTSTTKYLFNILHHIFAQNSSGKFCPTQPPILCKHLTQVFIKQILLEVQLPTIWK